MELDFQALMQQANENRLRSSYTVKALTEEAKNEARKRACKVNSNAVKTFLERKKRQEQLNLDRKIHEREQRLEERLRNSDRAACKVKEKSEAVRTTPHPAKDKGEKAKAQSSFSPSWPSRSRDLSLNSSSRPSDVSLRKSQKTNEEAAPGQGTVIFNAKHRKATAWKAPPMINFAKLMQVAEKNKSLQYQDVTGQKLDSLTGGLVKRTAKRDVCDPVRKTSVVEKKLPPSKSVQSVSAIRKPFITPIVATKSLTKQRVCNPDARSGANKKDVDRTFPTKNILPLQPVTTPKAVDVGKPRSLKKRKALPMSYTKYPNVPTASKLMRIDGRSADKRSTSELSLRELELRREFIRKYRQMCGAEPVEDESDDSYDSEMDDFIDDTPIGEEDEEFISNQIKMTLGYDRSKYKYVDDSDDLCMESNFKQICKEEARSAKLALLEDLNEYQKEQKMRRKISSRK